MKKNKKKKNNKTQLKVLFTLLIIIGLIFLFNSLKAWYKTTKDNYILESYLKDNKYTCVEGYECFINRGNSVYFVINTKDLVFVNRSLDYNITIDYALFYNENFMNYLPSVTYNGTVYKCFNSEGETKSFNVNSSVGDCISADGKSLLEKEKNLVLMVNNSLAYFAKVIELSGVDLVRIYNGVYSSY